MHPQRPKLADHVFRELQEGIVARRWVDWLPQERQLARELNVSRATLRDALQRLRAEKRIESLPSQGNRIVPAGPQTARLPARKMIVNLIVPSVTSRLRRSPVEWIDKLSAQLAAQGGHLRVVPADACYSQRPARALEKLIKRNPADCWIVRLSTLQMQKWLVEHQVPAVLVGTSYSGIGLPFIDVDHRALSRHAAGVLLAAGHRRITLLSESDLKAGDLESHRGFAQATMLDARHPNLRANVVRFADNVTAMIQHLDALLRERERPTALVLPNSIYCLTVWSHLGARGIRIPRDMSVVAHLGTSDLAYLTPEPAHYRLNVTLYVQRILRAILARVSGGEMRQESPLLPDFIRGGSIAGPA